MDEISGVLRDARPAFDIVVFLNAASHPARFRIEGEATAKLHDVVSSSWTSREAEAVHVHRLVGTQAAVARRLRITRQAVSDALSRARFSDLSVAEDAIRAWFQQVAATLDPTNREQGMNTNPLAALASLVMIGMEFPWPRRSLSRTFPGIRARRAPAGPLSVKNFLITLPPFFSTSYPQARQTL